MKMKARKEQLTIRADQHREQGFRVRMTLDLLAGAVVPVPAGTRSWASGSDVHNEELRRRAEKLGEDG